MGSQRVLIVDDEPGMLRAAERILAGTYEVATSSRPGEALALADTFDPDLLVCDIRMPEMDGFALAEAMRKRHPGVDLIFMTGSSTEPDAALVRAVRSQAFYFIQKPFDRQVLLTLVERCLELRRLRHAERSHTLRMERELANARAVQRTLLPGPSAAIGGFRVEARLHGSQELGGDLYDYHAIDGGGAGGVAFIIADACGHGASAALLTTVVKTSFRAGLQDEFDPGAVIERLAECIRHFGSGSFVTAFCGRIALGRLDYVNAGHPAAMLWRAGETTHIHATSPIVCGDFPVGSWPVHHEPWPKDSRLLACTDGLAEAPHRPIRQLAALLEAAIAACDDPAVMVDGLLDSALATLGGCPASDDIALLGVAGS